MAEHASQLYARNIQALLGLMISESGELTLDFEDEVIAGRLHHPRTARSSTRRQGRGRPPRH